MPRRCATSMPAAPRCERRSSSRDAWRAESRRTLWSARPSCRASSARTRSSSSVNVRWSGARSTTRSPSRSPRWLTATTRTSVEVRPTMRSGIHTCAPRGAGDVGPGDDPQRLGVEDDPGPVPGPGPTTPDRARRRAGPHLGDPQPEALVQRLGELEQQLVERDRPRHPPCERAQWLVRRLPGPVHPLVADLLESATGGDGEQRREPGGDHREAEHRPVAARWARARAR